MLEWQKHSQGSKEMPHYLELLEFLDLRDKLPRTWWERVNADVLALGIDVQPQMVWLVTLLYTSD